MGDLTILKGNNLPAYLKMFAEDETTSRLAGEGFGNRRLSIKGGAFREIVGGKEYRVNEERTMNVVIIKAAPKVSRAYYKGSYVEGEASAPVCWSSDSTKPDADVKKKQHNNCADCPMNAKGSGQGDSRACRFSQRVAVLIDGEIDKEEVYQLVLPSTSIFGDGVKGKLPLRAYAASLQKDGIPFPAVITQLKFDIDSPTPKLTFRPIRAVDEEEAEVIMRMMNSPEAEEAITLSVHQTDGVEDEEEDEAPKPKAKAKAAKPKVTKPVEVEDDEDDEEEEAPKPKKKAKPAPVEEDDEDDEEIAPPKKKAVKKAEPKVTSLAAAVEDWDDED